MTQNALPGFELAPARPGSAGAGMPVAAPGEIEAHGAILDFRVYGTPAPQGSKTRQVTPSGRAYTRESSATTLKPWRHVIAQVALAEREAAGLEVITEGALRLDVEFVMPRPKALRQRAARPDDAAKRPDRDKLLRAVQDALRGVLYADDAQAVAGETTKRIAEPGEPTGARIRIARA